MHDTLSIRFQVPFAFPIVFTRQVFAPGNTTLIDILQRDGARRAKALVIGDAHLFKAQPKLTDAILAWAAAHATQIHLVEPPRLLPGGEASKTHPALARGLVERMLFHHLSRHDYVFIIGGGGVLDAAGYAASLVHRGLRVIRLPSTALSQTDSGVGVKTAINVSGIKNAIGTFAPPHAVINDDALLDTLPDMEWIGGIAEAFKVAIIKDADFFDDLERHADALRRRDRPALLTAIHRGAELHAHHIATSGDPFEYGRARPLDFGHWAAHKIEAMTDFATGHGAAVATGVALDTVYAGLIGRLTDKEVSRILAAMRASGLPLKHAALDRRDAQGALELIKGLQDFQEHLGGELCITLPRGLGHKEEVHTMDTALIEKAVARLT